MDRRVERVAMAIAESRYEIDAEMWERWKRDPLWGVHAGDCEIAEPAMRGPITCTQCVVDELVKDAEAAIAALSNQQETPICVVCGKPAVGTCEKTEGFSGAEAERVARERTEDDYWELVDRGRQEAKDRHRSP